MPALDEFAPQLILFSAGFDAHAEDDMAMLRFNDAQWLRHARQLQARAPMPAERLHAMSDADRLTTGWLRSARPDRARCSWTA